MRRTRWLASGLLLLALGAVPGCANELESPTANKLRGLAKLYLDCAVSKSGPGPASEQEFKKHLRRLEGFVLRMNGVDPANLEAAFVSERDGEPFVILYGVSITRISGTSAPLVAHEKTGKNGKRLVAFANGKVEAVDEARFRELTAARK
jgi:hypothetical protein